MRVFHVSIPFSGARGKGRTTTKGRRFGGLGMVGRLTRKAWLQIAAVVAAVTVIVIVVAVIAGGDNQTDEVATGAPADVPGTESSPSTAGDTTAPTGGVTPHDSSSADVGVRRPGRRGRSAGSP